MKKITPEYVDAIKKYALNEETTKLILIEISTDRYDTSIEYEENEYLIGFKRVENKGTSEWKVNYLIPSPTLDELIIMGELAQKKIPESLFNEKSFKVEIDFCENKFETTYRKDKNGDFRRGYFILKG